MATFNDTTANNTLIGSAQSDYLTGLAGSDSFGGGSCGHDTLDGGGGNDTYVVDRAKDVVQEGGFDASDRVQASISIDLDSAAYDRIEHVISTVTDFMLLKSLRNGPH